MLVKSIRLAIGLACLGVVNPAFGGITGDLGLYSNFGNVATFDYRVTFEEAGSFDAFSIDVFFSGVGSDKLTDFGNFSFDTTVGDFLIDPPVWDLEQTFSDADSSTPASSIYRLAAPSGTSQSVIADTYLVGRLTFDYSDFDYSDIDFPVGEAREFNVDVTGQTIDGTPQTSFQFLPASGGIIDPDTDSSATWTQVGFGDGEGQSGSVPVSVPSNVPEPTSLAVFGLLGLAAAGIRRRVKR
jgi:hypothetical protein